MVSASWCEHTQVFSFCELVRIFQVLRVQDEWIRPAQATTVAPRGDLNSFIHKDNLHSQPCGLMHESVELYANVPIPLMLISPFS